MLCSSGKEKERKGNSKEMKGNDKNMEQGWNRTGKESEMKLGNGLTLRIFERINERLTSQGARPHYTHCSLPPRGGEEEMVAEL